MFQWLFWFQLRLLDASQKKNDLKAVGEAIHNVFGWAVKKEIELFFQTIADDSGFISVIPYDGGNWDLMKSRKTVRSVAARILRRSGMKYAIWGFTSRTPAM